MKRNSTTQHDILRKRNKTITDFFKPKNDSSTALSIEWTQICPTLLLAETKHDVGKPESKVDNSLTKLAAFDLDNTIFKPKNSVFPKHESDWILLYPTIPTILQTLQSKAKQEYKIVIFSNQLNISNKPKRFNIFKSRVEQLFRKLNVSLEAYFSTERDCYRKPRIGMFEHYLRKNNYAIDFEHSFYVGDAAGRRGDFSDSDIKFARNCGLKFYLPEAYFNQQDVKSGTSSDRSFTYAFDIKSLPLEEYSNSSSNSSYDSSALLSNILSDCSAEKDQVIVFVGGVLVGKTSFYENYLKPLKFEYFNQVSSTKIALTSPIKVVIDSRNPTEADRTNITSFLRNSIGFKGPIKCFLFSSDFNFMKHMSYYHLSKQSAEPDHVLISQINSFTKSFKYPTVSEGFDEIQRIPFIPTFHSEKEEKKFNFYYF